MMLREQDVVARISGVSVQRLRVWIDRGWIKPVREGSRELFSEADIARASLIFDLSDVLEIHEDVVPVILHLIDQIHGLRHEMKILVEAIDSLPEETRSQIKVRLHRLEDE